MGSHRADSAAHAKSGVLQSATAADCLYQTVSPVEKLTRTSQAPREKSAEVGSPPNPPQALRRASVA